MSQSPRRIGQLSSSVINKIAAGEVIERPASVLKELLENAVDAGADRIEVVLENGGLDRVRVSDNGSGINPEDLPLAVASHATSKIQSADDLFAVTTLGFRGEALASIAEVSHLTLRTRVAESSMAYEMSIRGGIQEGVEPCAAAVGTSLEVRNLFFNTPVRRKFLRGSSTELAHATESFLRIALAFPRIFFSLKHNDRLIHELPPVDNWADRIGALFGHDLSRALIAVESDEEGLRISGFVANPTHSRGNNKMQYLFLNGRHIRDRSLQHALGEAYRGLLLTGRFPICFLRMEMPPDQIDVNVHPTKLEVRFQDGGRVYGKLLSTIRSRFLTTDLTAKVTFERADAAGEAPAITRHHDQPVDDELLSRTRAHFAPTGAHAASTNVGPSAGMKQQASWQWPTTSGDAATDSLWSSRLSGSLPAVASRSESTPLADAHDPATHDVPSIRSDRSMRFDAAPTGLLDAAPRMTAMQVHCKYLVTVCDEGLMIIDQHALHERILYEQLRNKVLSRSVEIQRLLVPEPLELAPVEAAAVAEYQTRLAEIGIEVEPFGGNTVLLQGYPAMLGQIQPAEWLREVVAQMVGAERPLQRRDLLDELLHMMSCKAAIKTGDRLTPSEISALLEHRHLVDDAHHCPHGRPTTLVLTRDELDKRFLRI